MVYAELGLVKKNSVSTTLSSGITDSDSTIPVSELAGFHNAGTLITKGIVIGYNDANELLSEEITVTGASATSGAGNLTGASRGVKADGTAGPAKAWDSATRITVVFSTGIYDQIRDNQIAHESAKAPIASPVFTGNVTISAGTHSLTVSDYLSLEPMGCIIPVTNPASIDRAESGVGDGDYVYGLFTYAGVGAVGTGNCLHWKVTMPEDWKSDGDVSATVQWLPAAGTADHFVKWEIEAKQLANSDAMDSAFVSLGTCEDQIITVGDLHISPATTPAAISGTAGKIVLIRVTRIAAQATASEEDMRFVGMSLKYIRVIQ